MVKNGLANDFFLMGYVMCLRGCSRYFWLVFVCFFSFFSSYSFSVPNCKAWSTIPKDGGDKYPDGSSQIKTNCKLISKGSMGYRLCSSRKDEVNDTYIMSDDTGFTIYNRFVNKGYFNDGFNQFDEQYDFGVNLKSVYKGALLPSLIKALNNNNCDIANAILDAMQNPNIIKNGDHEFLGFQNGEDKCVVLSDGKTACKGPSYKTSKDKDGKTRLDIDPNGDWEKSLDDYSSSKTNDNINNPGSSDNKNKGDGSGIDERRGSGSSSGSGQANNGNNKPGDKGADKNDGKPGNGGNGGSSIGNGKGEGEGDDEGKDIGDVKMPKLETPDLEKIFNTAKNQIEDKVGSGYELSGGQCEPITIPVFNKIQTINVHCQILGKLDSTAGPVFTLLWTTLGVLIILSA